MGAERTRLTQKVQTLRHLAVEGSLLAVLGLSAEAGDFWVYRIVRFTACVSKILTVN